MDLDNLSDELKEKLEAVETHEELAAIAEENGFELSDDVLEDVAGGGGWRVVVTNGDSCGRVTLRLYCRKYDPENRG
ncbi:MAG: Nif11 family protein [Atopobiaceae bacterium]|nr:Nif11 family protein [Atopobiaceae bacterium]